MFSKLDFVIGKTLDFIQYKFQNWWNPHTVKICKLFLSSNEIDKTNLDIFRLWLATAMQRLYTG